MAQKRLRPPRADGTRGANGGKRSGSGRWGSGHLRCQTCLHPERGRIDFLLANGASQRSIAAQYNLVQQGVSRHYKVHVTARFKAMVQASHNDTFERLLKEATEANSESIDVLNLLIRGHTSQWALALEAGDFRMMSGHSARILQAIEVRSKITFELAPPGGITVNNFLMRDAAELVAALQGNEDAVARIEDWYRYRTQGKLIEAEIERSEVTEAAE